VIQPQSSLEDVFKLLSFFYNNHLLTVTAIDLVQMSVRIIKSSRAKIVKLVKIVTRHVRSNLLNTNGTLAPKRKLV